jgi:hypothetical protein
MTVSILSGWIIAIVVAVVLFGWVGAVLWANAHPGWKHQSKLPKYEVTGGAFQAVDGGRQLMPIPGERPAPTEEELARSGGVPGQRAATEEDVARARGVPGQRAAAEQGATGATSTGGGSADEPHLTVGSKLRLPFRPIRSDQARPVASAGNRRVCLVAGRGGLLLSQGDGANGETSAVDRCCRSNCA